MREDKVAATENIKRGTVRHAGIHLQSQHSRGEGRKIKSLRLTYQDSVSKKKEREKRGKEEKRQSWT
jgi:hypothetical protein